MKSLNIPVEEFTTPDPITAVEATPLTELIALMKDHGVRHLPILRNEKVVGIISDRDVHLASGLTSREKIQIQASDLMVLNPITVSSQESLEAVAFEMSQKKIGSVIVNDENDKLLGIFTVTDALNALIEIARSKKTISL